LYFTRSSISRTHRLKSVVLPHPGVLNMENKCATVSLQILSGSILDDCLQIDLLAVSLTALLNWLLNVLCNVNSPVNSPFKVTRRHRQANTTNALCNSI
jgi:hypothetical protein